MPERPVVERRLTEKEIALLRTRQDRHDRYLKTAAFVQSKWFLIGGTLGIALFLLVMFLMTR
jgi:hypothetical protein